MPWSHHLVSEVSFERSQLHASLSLQCSQDLQANGTITSPRVVGLKLHLNWRGPPIDEDLEFVPRLIDVFHSKLPAFPHLRVAELRAPLSPLRHAVKVVPQISNLPTLRGRLLYRWGCLRDEFAAPLENTTAQLIGVDPVTLEPSGTSRIHVKHMCLLIYAFPGHYWGGDCHPKTTSEPPTHGVLDIFTVRSTVMLTKIASMSPCNCGMEFVLA